MPDSKKAAPAFCMAIRSGAAIKPEISGFVVNYIIEQGPGIDYDGGMLLQAAIEAENIPLVSLCLDSGANPNLVSSGGRTPLKTAVSLGWNDDRRFRPKDIDADNRAATIIDLLLDHGADLSQKGVICNAAAFRSLDVIKKLIDRGGSVNDRDEKAATPLFFCADSLPVARYLVSHGADVNARDVDGRTPLMAMAMSVKTDIKAMRLILKSGAGVNSVSRSGQTALMAAALAARKPAIEALLKQGANRSIKDNQQKTALDRAAESGYRDPGVTDLLKKSPES